MMELKNMECWKKMKLFEEEIETEEEQEELKSRERSEKERNYEEKRRRRRRKEGLKSFAIDLPGSISIERDSLLYSTSRCSIQRQ